MRLPNWVGDAVMATPVLRALREGHPGAEIAVEGRPFLRELLLGLPTVDAFLDAPGRGVGATRRHAHELGARGFDWAVLLPDSVRAALPAALARIPVRVGYARDPIRRVLLTRALPPPRQGRSRLPVPMAERYLAVVRALGCPDAGSELQLAVTPEQADALRERLRKEGLGEGESILAVAPGASFGSSKLWPPEHFAQAADRIAQRHGLRPVLAPAPSELAIAARVAQGMRSAPLLLADPPIGLGELKALVARAELLLTNDTGPRQFAVAFGRPAVVVMGPTDPRHTAQHLGRQRVIREPVACSPCHLKRCPIDHRCMTRLSPERAVEAAGALLA